MESELLRGVPGDQQLGNAGARGSLAPESEMKELAQFRLFFFLSFFLSSLSLFFKTILNLFNREPGPRLAH